MKKLSKKFTWQFSDLKIWNIFCKFKRFQNSLQTPKGHAKITSYQGRTLGDPKSSNDAQFDLQYVKPTKSKTLCLIDKKGFEC